jgi:hypothetical protein
MVRHEKGYANPARLYWLKPAQNIGLIFILDWA